MNLKRSERIDLLKSLLKEKVLVLDGAMGTSLQKMNLSAPDFGGSDLEGLNEILNLKKPEVIEEIHKQYLAAGADIIETNTFGATPLVLEEYDQGKLCREINLKACEIARKAAWEYSSSQKPRFVAGSIGPTTRSLSISDKTTFDEMVENYSRQVRVLYEGDVDYYLIETCNDTSNIKACLAAIHDFYHELPEDAPKLPVAISVTIEPTGTMLAGQTVESLVSSIEHAGPLYIGINCAFGPQAMKEYVTALANNANTFVSCVPNAGLPDEDGIYQEGPDFVASILEEYIDRGLLNIIGGCCGTTPAHIEAMSKMAKNKRPRTYTTQIRSTLSGIDLLDLEKSDLPLMVGERTNSIGSKKFRDLIAESKFEEAAEIAKEQVKNGARIIDVCLANPDRNELEDMRHFIQKVVKKVRVPIMIDSTDERVVELALKHCQGKSIINSINLEDGEERFKKIVPLAKKYGAALVVGTIDEDPENGMAVTRQRKLEIATRSFQLLTEKYSVPPENLYFDPLVFPCSTGDSNYKDSAKETVEGVRLIKDGFPRSRVLLGLSNVSFGLPVSGREAINSVFFHHNSEAGMDVAIVNAAKIKKFSELERNEIELSENVLWNRGENPVGVFSDYFRGKKKDKVEKSPSGKALSPEEKIINNVVEGCKGPLKIDLEKLLERKTPLEIINGPLMSGMEEVGKLFNTNKMIVAEVLQSAEVMREAVTYLEPHLKNGNSLNIKETFLLATVKGDVHDIGKDLVDMILSNNGYKVINLGIKISSEQLIEAVKKYNPGIIGLSGLLVKSAQQMISTAGDLHAANIGIPIIVGGAALTRNFVTNKIQPAYPDSTVYYAKDAMDALKICNEIINDNRLKK